MAVQVDYRIAPSDQFSIYNPDTKSNKTITYFTLLAKIRGDLNLPSGTVGDITGGGSANYVSKFSSDKNIVNSQIYDTGTHIGIDNTSPTHKLDVNGGIYADYFQLDTSYSDGAIAGKFSWNPDREAAELGLNGTVSLILGQDNLWYVKNQTGTAIPKGRAVMAVGALGASSRILVAPMIADGSISPKYLIGITIEEIANGDDGFVVSQGKLRGFDTSMYTQGTVLYCDPNNAGQFTATEPTAPDLKLPIAFTVDSKSNGTLAVRVTAGTTISEANDVQLTSPSDNDFLVYNSTSGIFENEAVGIFKTIAVSGQSDVVADSYTDTLTLVAGTNITITTDASTDTITINSPDAGGTVTSVDITAGAKLSATGGPITTSGSITVAHIATEPADLPTMTDFITYVEANGGTVEAVGPVGQLLAALTGATVPTATSNTGGTVLQNIAVDDYGHVFGVSSITLDTDDIVEGATNLYYTDARARAAISAGTGISYDSGTGVISNSDKGSSQNIFKNIAVFGQNTVVADSNDDTLTLVAGTNITITTDDTTDTITINSPDAGGTVTSIATSAPITGGPITTTGTIGITQSGASTDGYLSSTDWNTFNSKEPALTKGNLTEATSAILTITGGSNAVIGSGTTIEVSQATTTTSGYLSSTDWNTFNDKEPALTKGNLTESTSAILTITGGTNSVIGSGTTIEVSQASSTTSGYLSSADWNTFNDKEPALTKGDLTETTSAVLTITGGTNAVIGSGTTIQVSQASTSTSGYLSSVDWNTFNDKEPAITKGNLTETTSAVLTITGGTNAVIGSGTTIQVSQATTTTSGYLSSADWNTFNDKEPAITKGNLTESTSAVLTITGGTNSVIGSGTSIQVSQATTTTSGYLSSTDWNTFNDKEPALTKGNLTETTSAILTISGGTNAVIGSGTTIAVSQATTTTSGYLSSTDWNTFNDKEPALTKGNLTENTSAILTITGGSNAVIGSGTTIQVSQASTSTDGYLSSTDWNTFNDKEPALTKGNLTETTSAILTITGGTNAVIGSGTTISVSQSTTSTDGYLSSTDWNTFNGKQNALTFGNLTETSSSILTITGGTNAVVGSGTTIAVAQASSTVDGFLSSTDWSTFDGKADYSFVNIAVSGQTDVVADAASDTLTLVAGSGVTITTDALTDSITIAATGSGGTVTSIATTAPIQGGPITGTGTISITQSGASTDGYLSSTDWNTFNDKEPALTKGNLTEATSSVLTITGGTNSVIGSGTSIQVSQSSSTTSGYLSSADWSTFNGKADYSFTTIAVSGQSDVVADSASDTLTLVAGSGVSITTDATGDSVTIAATGSGGTVTSIATSAPITGGPITGTGTIGITQATTSTDGYLSSTDWNTFNGKQNALTFGNLTESTSSVLTITGGTNAVIGSGTSIQISQATTSTSGYLSSTDWNTFNSKEPALTKGNLTEATSSILTITNGTSAVIGSGTTIAVAQAGTSTSGYLSSSDWNTFNNKTSNTGTVTSVDLTAGAKIAVNGGPITTSGSITVEHTTTDPADLPTMTSFISYVQANGGTVEAVGPVGQVLATLTGATVATSTANTGGTVLQNIAIDDYGHVFGVSSVTLDTDDITEGSTNLYFTNARARAAVSAGTGISYDSGTGVITNSSNIFETIAVSGQTSIVADSLTDTLTVAAGDRIDITTDAGTDTLTITHGLGDGVDLATAQAFQARVIADGGTFEAVWPIAVAIGALSGGTPANTESNNTDGEVLQNIAIDEFGHVLGYSSYDLDDRYVQSLIGGDGISVSGTPSTTAGAITVVNTDAGSDQNIFKNIAVSGQTTIVADSNDDTLTVAAGTGITLATTAASDTLTITNSAPDQTVVLTAGTGITTSGTYPSFTVTNSAPDQVVSLSAGTGITTSGTYPSFTITNSAPDQTVVLTAGTGISISGTYPSFTITNSVSQSNYTNLISAQVGESNSETTKNLTYGTLYSLSARAGVGALTQSTPVMDMYHFNKVIYDGSGGDQTAFLSSAFYSNAVNGTAVATTTDLIGTDFVYNSQMAAMMMQNHYNEQAKIDLSQVDAMLTIVGSLTLPEAVQTRLIVVHFGQYINSYDEAGGSTFTNKRPDVWQYGYSGPLSGTLTEQFFGLTMANAAQTDLDVSTTMSGWGFALVNVEDSGDYTSVATLENSSLIRIRCREEYYTI